jgi:serine/threonine protein kinase
MAHGPQDKIDRLFGEALSHPPGRRGAFLEERCDEPEVRQRVAALLADYEAATDRFDGLADAALAPMLRELEAEAGDEGTRSADPLDLGGTQVGRYRIEEHLGGGGMGVVYRARDLDLSRPVALKFLPPHLVAHPKAEERFVREARAAAALDHSNIATVHEIGETECGRRFIAMSYYDGETLKEALKDGLLPVEDVLDYAEQIAEGLARAHEAGIVHRDVKPANVMVTEGGAVKLVDFGLAQVTGQSRLTDPGRGAAVRGGAGDGGPPRDFARGACAGRDSSLEGPAQDDEIMGWTREFHDAMAPYANGGCTSISSVATRRGGGRPPTARITTGWPGSRTNTPRTTSCGRILP